MAGKISFLVGFGAGYVLGARSGRERYEQIAGKAQEVWRDPRVQQKAGQAQQLVKDKASEAGAAAAEKVSEKVGGKSTSESSPTPGTPSASTGGSSS